MGKARKKVVPEHSARSLSLDDLTFGLVLTHYRLLDTTACKA